MKIFCFLLGILLTQYAQGAALKSTADLLKEIFSPSLTRHSISHYIPHRQAVPKYLEKYLGTIEPPNSFKEFMTGFVDLETISDNQAEIIFYYIYKHENGLAYIIKKHYPGDIKNYISQLEMTDEYSFQASARFNRNKIDNSAATISKICDREDMKTKLSDEMMKYSNYLRHLKKKNHYKFSEEFIKNEFQSRLEGKVVDFLVTNPLLNSVVTYGVSSFSISYDEAKKQTKAKFTLIKYCGQKFEVNLRGGERTKHVVTPKNKPIFTPAFNKYLLENKEIVLSVIGT